MAKSGSKLVVAFWAALGAVACQPGLADPPTPAAEDAPSAGGRPALGVAGGGGRGGAGAGGGAAAPAGQGPGGEGGLPASDAGSPSSVTDGTFERVTPRTDAASTAPGGPADAALEAALPNPGAAGLTRVLAWDGEKSPVGSGWGKAFIAGTIGRVSLSTAQPSPAGRSPNHSWLFTVQTNGGTESGWMWATATSITKARYLAFWVKVVGKTPPRDYLVSLRDAVSGRYSIDPSKGFYGGSVRKFNPNFADGNWHEALVPLSEVFGPVPRYDSVKELCIRGNTPNADFQIFIDEIGFYE